MDKLDIKNLQGKCLVSMPQNDDNFSGSVVYICTHDETGAMGFVINKRIKEFSFSDLALELAFEVNHIYTPLHLYNGGPLERAKGFILHSADYFAEDSMDTGSGIVVSSSLKVLSDIASGHGPKQRLIALGYAGWAANQLEQEIADNRWLVAPATPDLVLGENDEQKWQLALDKFGIDATNLSPFCGRT
jgi:putative transcriptional regulator